MNTDDRIDRRNQWLGEDIVDFASNADISRRFDMPRRMLDVRLGPDGTSRVVLRLEPAEVTS